MRRRQDKTESVGRSSVQAEFDDRGNYTTVMRVSSVLEFMRDQAIVTLRMGDPDVIFHREVTFTVPIEHAPQVGDQFDVTFKRREAVVGKEND